MEHYSLGNHQICDSGKFNLLDDMSTWSFWFFSSVKNIWLGDQFFKWNFLKALIFKLLCFLKMCKIQVYNSYELFVSVCRTLQLRQSSDLRQWQIQLTWRYVTPNEREWRPGPHFYPVCYGSRYYGAVFKDPRSQVLTFGWVYSSAGKVQWLKIARFM